MQVDLANVAGKGEQGEYYIKQSTGRAMPQKLRKRWRTGSETYSRPTSRRSP